MIRSKRWRMVLIIVFLAVIVGVGFLIAVLWTGSAHGVFMARHATLDRELLPQMLLYLEDGSLEGSAILLENERYVFLISEECIRQSERVGVWHDKETGSFSYLVLHRFSNPLIPARPSADPP